MRTRKPRVTFERPFILNGDVGELPPTRTFIVSPRELESALSAICSPRRRLKFLRMRPVRLGNLGAITMERVGRAHSSISAS